MADDVDTRAITRRLRQDGSLIGVLSTEQSRSNEELLEMSRSWDIVGKNSHILFESYEPFKRIKVVVYLLFSYLFCRY